MMDDNQNTDICRVCRCEATPDKPLYHPCICTGSIRYIHQDCLVQWLRYSDKEFCELCNHRFSFIPIYSPDMPNRLPLKDIFMVLAKCCGTAARYWLQYTLVAIAWLGVIPLTAYGFYGCCVVMCTLCTFIFLLWLREQIIRVGAPEWLERPFHMRLFNFNDENLNENQDEVNENQINNNDDENEDAEVIGDNNDDDDDDEDANNNAHDVADNNLDDIYFDIGNDVEVENIDENVEDEVEQPNDQQPDNNAVVAQDWNPVIEWDRGAEDITWERILGLDGTFAFLENVFWVITLNTLFIFIFAYCPYNIGYLLFKALSIETLVTPHFDRFIYIFAGYLMIGLFLFVFHAIFSLIRLNRLQRFFGFCYIVVKVALLVSLEIGLFPTMIGWWLDICSLPLSNSLLQTRIDNFFTSPGTSLFIHWLVGMICIFYFGSFIFIVEEVVRPGVLSFIHNLIDPNFNPVNEMINLSVISHIQRFIVFFTIFGTAILLIIYIPITIIQKTFPNFLPYYNHVNNDTSFTELLVELFFFQVIIPIVADDRSELRNFIKSSIRLWCRVMAYILNLKSYLLGNEPNDANNDGNEENAAEVDTSQPYVKPKLFAFRVIILVALLCATLSVFGLYILTVPFWYGRGSISYWLGENRVNEFNSAAYGVYVNIVLIRLYNVISRGLPFGFSQFFKKIYEWIPIMFKMIGFVIVFVGIVPFMIGLLFDLVVLTPLRVPINQTPLLYHGQDWAFGVLLTKVFFAIIMMTDLPFKESLEHIYNNGFININFKLVMKELAIPLIGIVGLILALPYASAETLLSLFGASFELHNYVIRRIHSMLFVTCLAFFLVRYQINKLTSLYEHIRNDKYLVGKRLVNYEPNKSK